jgi:hypothetical protein
VLQYRTTCRGEQVRVAGATIRRVLRSVMVASIAAVLLLFAAGSAGAQGGKADGDDACAAPCLLTGSVGGAPGRVVAIADDPNALTFSCRTTCRIPTDYGPTYTITATPDPGSVFTRWWGDCTPFGSNPVCTLFMDYEKKALAQFHAEGTTPSPDEPVWPDLVLPGGPLPPPPPPPPAPAPPPAPPSDPGPPGLGCTIVGTEGPDSLDATSGDDVICGLGGADHIHAGGGYDVVYAGAGADEIELGFGSFVVNAGSGDDEVAGGAAADVIRGGDGRDHLRGAAGADRVEGGAGPDRIVGGPGADTLAGGPGADTLLARDGVVDRVSGGAGRDVAQVDRRDRVFTLERRVA